MKVQESLVLGDEIRGAAIAGEGLSAIGERVVNAFMRLTSASSVRLYTRSEKSARLELTCVKSDAVMVKKVMKEAGVDLHQYMPRLHKGTTTHAKLAAGETLLIRSATEIREIFAEQFETEELKGQFDAVFHAIAIRSLIMIPLIFKDSIFGLIIMVFSGHNKASINSNFERFAQTVRIALAKIYAELEVEKQREFTFKILDRLPADLAVFDENHRYVYVNPMAIRDEVVRKWIIGKDDFEYCRFRGLDEQIAVGRRTAFIEAIRGGPTSYWVDVHKTADGKEKHIMRMFHPIIENGHFVFMVGYGVDITGRVRAEEETRRLAQIVANSTDAIVSANPQGVIQSWNKGAEVLFGYPAGEVLGQMVNFLVPEDKMDEAQILWTMVRRGQTISNVNTLRRRKDASLVDISLSIFPINDDKGNILSTSAIMRDITEQKKREAEHEILLRELNRKFNELMQFNYIVSHNLRAPVTKILGLANILKLQLTAEERDQINTHLFQSVESMDTMIKDLGAILAARSPLNEKAELFSLSSIIEIVKDNLERPIRDSNAAVLSQIDENADMLTTIKSYVQSIMFNLVSNAIKYKSRERHPLIQIKAQRENGRLVISVRDNGLGIDMDKHKDHLFGLYKRFHEQSDGRGLGLYMTRTQIESLGGDITLKSKPGLGSTFTISLPMN